MTDAPADEERPRGPRVLLTAVLDVGAIWVLSSVLWWNSLYWFVAGVAVVGVLAWLRARGADWPRTLRRVTLAGALTVLLLEAVLHIAPGVVPPGLANHVYGGYRADRGGIYAFDDTLAVAMHPRFSRRMYHNGHVWNHATDDRGLRSAHGDHAASVFLGDSMIYGHGVEFEDTVSEQFAELTGEPAANLGQQGMSLVQSSILLRRHGLDIGARWVFVCNHPNDLDDTLSYYTADEIRRFTETPAADSPDPTSRNATHVARTGLRACWRDHAAFPLLVARVLSGIRHMEPRERRPPPREDIHVPNRRQTQKPFDPEGPDATDEQRLTWDAHKQAMARIKSDCDRIGAEAVFFDIGFPTAYSRAIQAHAEALGARYSDAGAVVLRAAMDGEEVYLRNDGHWTPLGAAMIARELHAAVGAGR